MSENEKKTVIANGTRFEGAIKSDCDVTLGGKLAGEISAPSLKVERTGSVDGRVEVTQLESEGEVCGQIIADDVRLAGRVGNKTVILATTLEVKLNDKDQGLQVAFGDCELQVGEKATRGSSVLKKVAEEQEDRDSPVPVGRSDESGL
jgi:cytoskeletal protein CcmA (bactofilin family)